MNGQIDIGGVSPSRYFFGIAALLGLLLAMTGVESERPAWTVFVQWQLQTLLPMALLITVQLLLLKNRFFTTLNPWLALIASGVAGASLFAPLALLIEIWFEPRPTPAWGSELLQEWVGVVPPVTLCWLALNAPWLLGYRLEKTKSGDLQPETPEADDLLSAPAFMALLTEQKRGRLMMLKSELHYLQVATENGSSLILYKLADAVSQLPRGSGLLVHRSYWVALDAIEDFSRQGRQAEIRLINGFRVPVSRSRLAAVCEQLTQAASGAGVACSAVGDADEQCQ